MAYQTFEQHLDPERGPKRILTLDGGGLRGFISIGILREIEDVLRQRHGNDPSFRLAHYFDLIAGTSTGAIISAALSLGMSVDEVHDHYTNLGSYLFKRSRLRWGILRAKYDADRVRGKLIDVFGERQLDSTDLLTGLLIVTKRMDTGSAWPITNHPKSKYFLGGQNATTVPNGHYPLWQVVRASTAAPHFFDPEMIQIGRAELGLKAVTGHFVDGGVSPANNPALQAVMTATMDGYRFGWATGEDQMLVVSVGTGMADSRLGRRNVFTSRPAVEAITALQALMADCADQVETIMQWLSSSQTARTIDRVVGMVGPPLGGAPMFTYNRYNVLFQSDWWQAVLDEQLDSNVLRKLEAMDVADNIPELERIGRRAGNRLVNAKHFSPAFDL